MKPQQGRTARYILWALGFPLALWLAAALADAFSGGASLSRVLARFSVCMNAPFSVRWTKDTGRFLLLAGLLYPAGAVAVESGRGNRRPGEEYGSARWGDPRTIGKKYRDRRHREKNILLTQHVALGLDGRITKRNTHQLVVGGSGAGKTRYFCLPNVMNACCSYIITDCKGEILRAVGGLFEKQGIPFTVLDLVNMRGHYNPFAYLRRDSDALRLVTNLVANTTPRDAKNSDPFWDRAETALLQALILYLKHRAPVCEQNFTMVMEMINAAEVREGDPNFKSALDLLFDELESDDPQSIALKQYKVFKQAQDKTAKSILIGAAVRLAAFNLPELARVTDSDEMYIGRLGEEKRAIFCVIPDNDTSLNFLVSMDDQDYICLDETGHLLRPDYVTCKFSQLVKKRGLKKITFHGLRHSCASMLYERGQDMKKIQEWLGHSTPVTTETIYAHLNVKHKDETAWIANDCLPLVLPEKMREKPIQTA